MFYYLLILPVLALLIYKNRKRIRFIVPFCSKILYFGCNKSLQDIIINEKCAIIPYNYVGQKYFIFLPYKLEYVLPMSFLKVELCKRGQCFDITQQPGLPYLVTARELDGDYIKITNIENGKFHVYGPDVLPQYGQEVFDV